MAVENLKRSWRCSNCAEPAELKDGYIPMDPRYGIGFCGSCSLRGEVPLTFASHDEAHEMVAARKDKKLIAEQLLALTVGRIPTHARRPKCCEGEDAKREHLTTERLDMLMAKLRVDTGT